MSAKEETPAEKKARLAKFWKEVQAIQTDAKSGKHRYTKPGNESGKESRNSGADAQKALFPKKGGRRTRRNTRRSRNTRRARK